MSREDANEQEGSDGTDTGDDVDVDEWCDGQRGLDGQRAAGQARFNAPASPPDDEPRIESHERNPGGLLADERDESTADADATDDAPLIDDPEYRDAVELEANGKTRNPGGLLADLRPIDDDAEESDDDDDGSHQATLGGA